MAAEPTEKDLQAGKFENMNMEKSKEWLLRGLFHQKRRIRENGGEKEKGSYICKDKG